MNTQATRTAPPGRPLIGITCSTGLGPNWTPTAPGQYQDFAYRDYALAVEAGGGLPILIPTAVTVETALAAASHLDGLLLAGGVDISPRCYHQGPGPELQEVDYQRDLVELALARQARDSGRPCLGICRGSQLLAVAFGGVLYQDISGEAPIPTEKRLAHVQQAPKNAVSHSVNIKAGSLLGQILEGLPVDPLWVNSHHHQAVRDIPPGFRVAARAADGLVEAIELPEHPFMLGVQWHPEGTWREDQAAARVFAALANAARVR